MCVSGDVALPGTCVSLAAGPGAAVEELLTDSRWGCSPIRARLLEDDDNGGLGGPGRTWGRGRRVMPTAVSPDQLNRLRGIPSYSVMWPASTDSRILYPVAPSLFLFAAFFLLLLLVLGSSHRPLDSLRSEIEKFALLNGAW